jgi:hypothetical protein
MDFEPLYSDKLVTLTAESIRFAWYYFPCGAKTVRLAEIERVELFPTSATFNLRGWGSGDLRTWSPLDSGRSRRRFAYLLARRGKWSRIAFSVTDDDAFQAKLREAGLRIQAGDREYFTQGVRRTAILVLCCLGLGPLIAGLAVLVDYLHRR